MKLPQEFLTRMQALLGDEYDDFMRTYEEPRRLGLRVNTLKITPQEFLRIAPFHLKPIPWTSDGFFYRPEDAPARHPFYYAGLYYLQEPSAMAPAQVLPVNPGDRVLDLCAAPGGKATELAARLRGKGLLVANEISASRAKALLKNLEVFGVTNAFVTNTNAANLAAYFPEAFDRILVDAPCSGEGMFRKDAANAQAWSLEKVRACARTQKELLLQAAGMLRPGGLLLYSTCTFSPEEDEQAAAFLLGQCPQMELLPIPACGGFAEGRPELAAEDWMEHGMQCQQRTGMDQSVHTGINRPRTGAPELTSEEGVSLPGREEDFRSDSGLEQLRRTVRIFPHRLEGEGHFLALFRKQDGTEKISGERTEAGKFSLAGIFAERPERREENPDSFIAAERPVRKAEDSDLVIAAERPVRKAEDSDLVIAAERPVRHWKNFNSAIAADSSRRKKKGKKVSRREACEEQAGCPECLRDFLRDIRIPGYTQEQLVQSLQLRGSQAYFVPAGPGVEGGIPFLRCGLYLGEIRKNRFEPSQALAMALQAGGYASVLNLSSGDERVLRYLCGETIAAADLSVPRPDGWQLVCVDDYPLGWGRLKNGTLKNKYHIGWRMQSR